MKLWIGRGVIIQKDELIQLHVFLIQLKINLEDMVENYFKYKTGLDSNVNQKFLEKLYSITKGHPYLVDIIIDDILKTLPKRVKKIPRIWSTCRSG